MRCAYSRYFSTLSVPTSSPFAQINGNLIALNALSGIPLADIKGFRAPFLNYSTHVPPFRLASAVGV